jgi:lipopolysaccharide/colanic/teichoic acid biosynthesis glycosyltransferase
MACLALLVRLESPRPALYPQDRIGRRRRPCRIWKFRSMRVGSDEGIHQELAAQWFAGDESMRGYKSLRDGRITRVGRLLRRTSLDELPQLLNGHRAPVAAPEREGVSVVARPKAADHGGARISNRNVFPAM